LNGDAIYTSTCLLGLTHFVSTDNALDLVFTNFSRVSTFFADVSDVKLDDSCLPPIVIEIPLDLHTCILYNEHSYRMCALGDYSLLFSFLSNYGCSCVLVITHRCCSSQLYHCYSSGFDLAVSRCFIRRSRFPH